MSFKYAAEKHGPGHYVLSKGVKVPVNVFLSDELYQASEEEAWSQMAAAANMPGVVEVAVMPDTHVGYGVPIGIVIKTKETILPTAAGFDIGCFTGDTKVSLVDGREMTFVDLVAQYGSLNDHFFVYSMTPDGKVTAGKASHPRKTRKKSELVEVEIDDGQKIKCTPDHEFMLRDGTYRRADSLVAGDSLMPLYRSLEAGYCCVQHPADLSTEKMYRASFREFNGYVPAWPQIIHHDIFKEGNPNPTKTNDDPRFLVEMNEKAHFQLHSERARERALKGEIGFARLHALKPEQCSAVSSRTMKRLHKDPKFQADLKIRATKILEKARAEGKLEANFKSAGQRGRKTLIEYNLSERGRNNPRSAANMSFRCEFCDFTSKSGYIGVYNHKVSAHRNHKVRVVRQLKEHADVYCLTVEKYGNFALSAGVFVHNCGMVQLRTDIDADKVADKTKRRAWIDAVTNLIGYGKGESGKLKIQADFDDVVKFGAKALGRLPGSTEREFIPVEESHKLPEKAKRGRTQLGSLGGGNHFCEMQVEEKTGKVWVMIHTGSRGYGHGIADEYFSIGAELLNLPTAKRELAWFDRNSAVGRAYWALHNQAANFAIANRVLIGEAVCMALEDVFGGKAEVFYEISHNLIQEEDGFLVHRKGSTRAFPPGHPSLRGGRWESTGHPILIPGSMATGSAILYALPEASKSCYSVNHGSGRVMGRNAAKRTLDQAAVDRDMTEKDILINTRNTPLDESGPCYKDLDKVLETIKETGLAKVAHRLKPVACIKGND